MNKVILVGAAADGRFDTCIHKHFDVFIPLRCEDYEPNYPRTETISGFIEFTSEQKEALLEFAEELRVSYEKLENALQKLVNSQRVVDFDLTRLSEFMVRETDHYRSFEPAPVCTIPYRPKIKKSQYEKSSYQRSGFQSSRKLARGRI